jgi:hypothetical protein
MAKDEKNVEVEDLEDILEDDETEEVEEEPKGIRPNDLAKELGVNPKSLRAYLRKVHTRPNDAKNTSWYLSDAQADDVREHFAPQDDDAEETEEVEA